MKIKTGDSVKVLAGKDRGKTGKVLQAFPALGRASVAGVNISYKHLRARGRSQAGQKVEFPSPLAVANLAVVCPHCGKETRVGYQMSDEGKTKQRICKKCKGAI